MLNELCRELNNWFTRTEDDKHIGTFTISDGVLTPSVDLLDGQYFRIVGSVLNDGVYQYTGQAISTLVDETFDGAIWGMAVPPEVLALASDVKTWTQENSNHSPYQSESFGNYSYSRKSDANGNDYSWVNAFSGELKKWRKL